MILITRPAPSGKKLSEDLNQAGFNTLWLPTIEFAPPKNSYIFQQELSLANNFAWLIFISPEAVRTSINYLPNPIIFKIAAIGNSTAQELIKSGFAVAIQLKTTNNASENLLALPEFQNISQQKIAIIKGAGGRKLLAQTLKTRNANITEIITYQRRCPIINNLEYYQTLILDNKINIILITSNTGLINLIKILGDKCKQALLNINLIVISARLNNIASQLGFKHCYQAKSAAGDDIISVLNEI